MRFWLIPLLMLVNLVSVNAQTRLTFICTGLEGYGIAAGPQFEKPSYQKDGFGGGILTVLLQTQNQTVVADVIFKDAVGSVDARKEGAQLTFQVLNQEAGLLSVTSQFSNAVERYVFQLHGNNTANVIMSQSKMILGNYKASIFNGTCTVS